MSSCTWKLIYLILILFDFRAKEFYTGSKSYRCEHCGKSFSSSFNLSCHWKVHEKKLFNCLQCAKSFGYLHNLQRHLRIHTGEKPYICSKCSKSFCPVIWVPSTFKNSFWGETLQLLPMFKVICPFIWAASTFKNSLGGETLQLRKLYKVICEI